MGRAAAAIGIGMLIAAAATVPGRAAASALTLVIRVGGPSAPADAKIAVIGSSADLAGTPFSVVNTSGALVARGVLHAATGDPTPFAHAETADLSSIRYAGSFTVVVNGVRSRPWAVRIGGTQYFVPTMLNLFSANADGNERSAYHSPSHLNDATAVVVGGPANGIRFDLTGGWMDAGDYVKSAAGIAYAVLLLDAAAIVDSADSSMLSATAQVGVRWLLKAHPKPGVFIGQVGDANIDHATNASPEDHLVAGAPGYLRRPELDDTRTVDIYGNPVSDLIRHRRAHATTDPALAAKVAAALALDSRLDADPAVTRAAAIDWYSFARAHASTAPPNDSNILYSGDFQAIDDLGTAAAALYQATGATAYLTQALSYLARAEPGAGPDLADTDPYGEALLCGALGGRATAGNATDPTTPRGQACALLAQAAQIGSGRAEATAFATPGEFVWGHNCRSAAVAAVSMLGAKVNAGLTPVAGETLGERARDYLLGLNPWERAFVAYPYPGIVRPSHWAITRTNSQPAGALVGGPASADQFASQGIPVPNGPYDSTSAGYVDNVDNYVANEPSIECQAEGLLLLSQLG